MIQLMTGHNFMCYQQNKIDDTSPICRSCGLDDESSEHITTQCQALVDERRILQFTSLPAQWIVNRVADFVRLPKIAALLLPRVEEEGY